MSGIAGGQSWAGNASANRFAPPNTTLGFTQGAAAAIAGVRVDGLGGNDSITGLALADSLSGGADNDIISGLGGADTISGGTGRLDRLYGGEDDDLIIETGEGATDAAFIIDGGNGTDTLRLDGAARLIGTNLSNIEIIELGASSTLAISAANFTLVGTFHIATTMAGPLAGFIGTNGTFNFSTKTVLGSTMSPSGIIFTGSAFAEVVTGTGEADVIAVGAGVNDVRGGNGHDTLIGAGTLRGEGGDDDVSDGVGTNGVDRLEGNAGNDTVSSERGGDSLTGGPGNDLLLVSGFDVVGRNMDGGDNDDMLLGGRGNDTLIGGAGNDTFASGGGNDTFSGGAGTDEFQASGNVTGHSFTGLERLSVAAGVGPITAGSGFFDLFTEIALPTTEAAVFRAAGGGIYDLVSIAYTAGTAFRLDANAVTVGVTLLSDAGAQFLRGGALGDSISSGAGADTAYGGSGSDSLAGGAGNDLLYGGNDGDSIAGGGDVDRLWGDAGADTLNGGAGADQLTGGTGADNFLFEGPGLGADRVLDYVLADDTVLVGAAGFGLSAGALDPARFEANTTGLASSGSVGMFVYNTALGRLMWDANGATAGGSVLIAAFTGAPALTPSEIMVV